MTEFALTAKVGSLVELHHELVSVHGSVIGVVTDVVTFECAIRWKTPVYVIRWSTPVAFWPVKRAYLGSEFSVLVL